MPGVMGEGTLSDAEWLAQYRQAGLAGPATVQLGQDWDPGNQAQGSVFIPQDTGDDMGNLFTDIYETVDQTIFRGLLPGGAAPFEGPGGLEGLALNFLEDDGTGGGNGGGQQNTGGARTMGHDQQHKNDVYKMVNGEWRWVHSRKRRCKRLLSASQARDLQLLMSITGKSSELTKIIVARGGLC